MNLTKEFKEKVRVAILEKRENYGGSDADYSKSLGIKTDVKINKEMNLGICNFDTINPLLTQNKDVQYVDKLVFNSLVNVNKNFEIENDLAQEISKINDKTYIIKTKEKKIKYSFL